LVTDAELDFKELSKGIELQWGETTDYKTGFCFKTFDKRVPWHIRRETPSLNWALQFLEALFFWAGSV
jgi:hypothetical protein